MSDYYTESQVDRIAQDAHDGAILEAGKEWERQRDEFNSIEHELETRIAELEQAQRWIPVSERLPEDGAPVLVHFNVLNDVIVAYHDSFHPSWETGGDWNYVDEKYDWATHWMPIPQPPDDK